MALFLSQDRTWPSSGKSTLSCLNILCVLAVQSSDGNCADLDRSDYSHRSEEMMLMLLQNIYFLAPIF
jgi:hypothetical protein